ncbi:Adenosine receptor A2b [Holothuria leucospilota]|uniref:Adenosine receptor A2b n=1 Tax=Holothuria leucospilota TaxID=206669 RepID=A0A9Q1BFB8_HOLLE|nr:Adenosine receptor A2b [Holothuria leucospilota]
MDNQTNFTPANPESITVFTTYFICELIIALLAVVGNSAIIVAFLSNRKLRTTQNYYIVSLAAIDFSMGFIAIPFVLITLDGTPYDNKGLCFFFLTCIVLMDLCSIFSVMALTVDRYLAICKPFSYHAIMTPRRTLIHISIAWIVPIAISLLVPLGWNIDDKSKSGCFFADIVSMKYYTFLYVVCFLPLFFIMCGMYRKIFIVIQSQVLYKFEFLPTFKFAALSYKL